MGTSETIGHRVPGAGCLTTIMQVFADDLFKGDSEGAEGEG